MCSGDMSTCYTIRNGEQQFLGRSDHGPLAMSKTVSREQCSITIGNDGFGIVTSMGRRPTGVRENYATPWAWLYKDQRKVIADGTMISLDAKNPERHVFTCVRLLCRALGGPPELSELLARLPASGGSGDQSKVIADGTMISLDAKNSDGHVFTGQVVALADGTLIDENKKNKRQRGGDEKGELLKLARSHSHAYTRTLILPLCHTRTLPASWEPSSGSVRTSLRQRPRAILQHTGVGASGAQRSGAHGSARSS